MKKKSKVVVQTEGENFGHDAKAPERQATVKFHINADETCEEVTTLVSMSKSGASFYLSRPCHVGRLVTLEMPMPAELRAYGVPGEIYPVIGLVQYCYQSEVDGELLNFVGVAFVGEHLSAEQQKEPMQCYYISGTTAAGMWQITPSLNAHQVRSAPRFWTELDITITRIRKDRTANYKEQTVTTNVSVGGAAVVCTLDVSVGERIKFGSSDLNFYAMAIVRDRQTPEGKRPTINLEFVESRFPVEKIIAKQVTRITEAARA